MGTVPEDGTDATEAFKYMALVLVFVHRLARACVFLLKLTWVSQNGNDKMAVYKGLDNSCIRYLLPERYRICSGSNSAIQISPDRPTDPTVYDRATHSAPFLSRGTGMGSVVKLLLERVKGGQDTGK